MSEEKLYSDKELNDIFQEGIKDIQPFSFLKKERSMTDNSEVKKLAELIQRKGKEWESLDDPITPLHFYLAQAILDENYRNDLVPLDKELVEAELDVWLGKVNINKETAEFICQRFGRSPDNLSAWEYKRLAEWLRDAKRKPANVAFTASACRDAARVFEQWIEERPKVDVKEIEKVINDLLTEFLRGLERCNTPGGTVDRIRATILDFLSTKDVAKAVAERINKEGK